MSYSQNKGLRGFIVFLVVALVLLSVFGVAAYFSDWFTDWGKPNVPKTEYTREDIEGSSGWVIRDDLRYETLRDLSPDDDWSDSAFYFSNSDGVKYLAYFYSTDKDGEPTIRLVVREAASSNQSVYLQVSSIDDKITYFVGDKDSCKSMTVQSLLYKDNLFSVEKFLLIFEK